MTREQAYAAIFAKIVSLSPAPFKTYSRRLRLVETFDTNAMPALFQQQINEPISSAQFSVTEGGIEYSVLNISWYIYVSQADDDAAMSPPLNDLVDSVINLVFGSPGSNVVDVGTENFALIPTSIVYYEGLLGDRAVARIDIQAKPLNLP